MLSAPVKSARRISSLFNMKTNRDSASSSTSSGSPKQMPSNTHLSVDHRRARSHSRPAVRHASSPQPYSTEARPTTSHGFDPDHLDLNSPLPPPPSLYAINHDLGDSGPPQQSDSRQGSRSASATRGPGPRSRTPDPHSHQRRRSWMLGKSNSIVVDAPVVGDQHELNAFDAWVAGLDQKIPYDLARLMQGEQIRELWNEQGDTFVYLFPQATQRPPSFRIDSTLFSDSPSLNFLARGTDPKIESVRHSTQTLTITDPDGATAQEDQWANDAASSGSNRMALVEDQPEEVQELHLYLPVPLHGDVSSVNSPLSIEDSDTLMLFRNLFAFLLGQALIATPRYPSLFAVLLEVSNLLRRFEFSNFDGSNFGEIATSSFANYCDELHLADVRKSREKTIEAVILGESLRYYPLYVEGFVHGVGKMEELRGLQSPKFNLINPLTQKRLERGAIDLQNRLTIMRIKLDEFDFPALFSGIANSNSAAEGKVVRFKQWKLAHLALRKHVLSYYRHKYGSWPPKANSKKNEFEESGLNRLLLKEVYEDFTDLYDMLVDRTSLTTRTTDMATEDLDVPDPIEAVTRAMRRMMSEYDRSTPPVQPPIPFDIPQLPNLQAIRRKPVDPKNTKERQKKLHDSEINEVLMRSYTREALKPTPFVESFMQFERRSAHGKGPDDLMDNRIGQWLFIYAVLQSLPLLVIDALDLRFTDGVEYFLCVAPRGGAPWIQNDGKSGRSWFGVAGGQGVVSLPSDVVNNATDAVYRRSHCWQIASQWADRNVNSPITTEDGSSLFSAPPAPQSSIGSISDVQSMLSPGGTNSPHTVPRTNSPGFVSHGHRGSIYNTLEALPLPAGVMPVEPPAKPFARMNPTMSFDDILKDIPASKGGKKK